MDKSENTVWSLAILLMSCSTASAQGLFSSLFAQDKDTLFLKAESYSHRPDITNWSNQTFAVADYFTFDEDVVIENSTFWMHPDAQIRIDANADVEFINCTFTVSDCNPTYKWDAILMQSQAEGLTLTDCQILDAYRGVYNDGVLAPIRITATTFQDCRSSIVLKNLNWFGPGPLGNFTYAEIYDNRFQMEESLGNGVPLHPNSPLSILNELPPVTAWTNALGPAFQNPAVQIIVDDVKNFILGDPQENPNYFEAHPQAAVKHLLNDGSHVLVYDSYATLQNNSFATQDALITAEKSSLIIGGDQVGEDNSFNVFKAADLRGIHLRECAVDITHNTFTQVAGIVSINPTLDFVQGPTLGLGSRIDQNTFNGAVITNSQGTDELWGAVVLVKNTGSTPPAPHPVFSITENAFKKGSRIQVENIDDHQSMYTRFLIHSNGFHGEGFDEAKPLPERAYISVLNAQDVIIAENNMDCSQPDQSGGGGGGSGPGETPGGPGPLGTESSGSSAGTKNYFCPGGIGIFLENCQDCEVLGNGNSPLPPISTNEPVKIGGEGIRLKGDVSGTQLHCNELDSNLVHINLDHVSAWAHQISGSAGVDNVFTNFLGTDIGGQLGTGAYPLSYDYFRSLGANLNPHVNLTAGSISVLNSASNGCNSLSKYKNSPNSVEHERNYASHLSIYPNPAVKALTLETHQPGEKAYLRSIDGKVVRQFIINKASQDLSLKSLSPGVYLLQYGSKTKKLLIQQ